MDKLRDLEVYNETRKILARMMNKILDEVFQTQIHAVQQAFIKHRDILVNNVRMHATFRNHIRNHQGDSEILLVLLLDCSKGCKLMSWSWIDLCLERSRIPPSLRNMIVAMLS